jgi:hypothetical protein
MKQADTVSAFNTRLDGIWNNQEMLFHDKADM